MKPFYETADVTLYCGDCREVMAALPSESVDSIVCDPPYPEISRPYGRLTEPQWHELMRDVVAQSRRVLSDTGSAVYILQPNSERVGRMRPWLWEFMAWTAREWNQVQDAWWWNFTRSPTVHCNRVNGLMRPSVKACVWLGSEDCYRNQRNVLWKSSDGNIAARSEKRALEYQPSGGSMRRHRCASASIERGGVTPFNLIPASSADSAVNAGANGHGAGTPMKLTRWWTRYITPPDGTVLDPLAGSGTTLLAARAEGFRAVGIEQSRDYCDIIVKRLKEQAAKQPLLTGGAV